SFEYRAVGGDDESMEWILLEVVEPPRIVDLQVHLDPPAYTDLPAEKAGRHIRAWEGTCVRMEGKLDKPLRSLSLVCETSQQRRSIPAQLTRDGLRFTVPAPADEPWVLQSSGSYWFDWLDREGDRLPDVLRSEIHVQRDAPPTVSIVAPTSDSYFTNQAFVPLRIVAKDDLAVRGVVMKHNGTHLELYRAAEKTPPTEPGGEEWVTDRGDSLTVDYPWDLGQIPEIQSGDTIEFQVAASDFKPQTGQATTMRIAIISPRELAVRIDQRQASIAAQLSEALRLQRMAHSQTMLLQAALEDAGVLSQDDVDYLQATDLNQRQVHRLLAGEVGGAADRIRVLLNELHSNRINRPQITNRLTGLRREITELSKSQLPRIQGELTLALKAARADLLRMKAEDAASDPVGPEETSAARASLSTAALTQDEVMERLEILIGQWAQWESYRQLTHDVEHIYREQDEIAQQTAALSTAALPLSTLSPGDRANLKRLVRRQMELARTFDRLHSRLGASEQTLLESDPSASAAIGEAMNVARSLAIGGRMREAAGRIDGNRIGQATQLHDELLQGLRELLGQLDPRRERPSLDTTSMAELSLLRSTQVEINERTVQLDKTQITGSRIDEPSKTRFDQLAEDQSRLASLTEAMLPASVEHVPSEPNATHAASRRELDRALQAAGIPGFGLPMENT
ncbi:MAG: hypothetical protein ACC628_27175, partial [Pirellulaceae bacterium]